MPELPEVHALVGDLHRRLVGRVVERFEVLAIAALKTFEISTAELAGRTIDDVMRHGKFLDLTLGDLHLVVHLARSGWIRWRDGPAKPVTRPGKGPLAARLVLAAEDEVEAGSGIDLTEAATKKSLAIYLVRDLEAVPGIARLGPDPLEKTFTRDVFAGILAGAGRSQVKGVLRNQALIAGIGNAYSDEILHAAKMSPFKPAAMPDHDVDALYGALLQTLRDAVARADGLAAAELKAEKKSNLKVHGRSGEACPMCGDTIRQVTYADSSLQYCPTCQTGGKPLADRVLSRLLK